MDSSADQTVCVFARPLKRVGGKTFSYATEKTQFLFGYNYPLGAILMPSTAEEKCHFDPDGNWENCISPA